MSLAKKGKTPANFATVQRLAWESCTGRTPSDETRRKMSDAQKGEKSHLWRGGVTSVHKQLRNSMEYKAWRKSVFERDNYSCVMCGDYGVYLQADHIKPFAYFSELRFDINNGRTLCVECHRGTPTYSSRVRINKSLQV